MSDANVQELFEILYESNKYLIKIRDHGEDKWVAYMYKNQHIQLDTYMPNATISSKIDIPKLLEYIDNTEHVRIKYTYVYDDFKDYNKIMSYILNEIQNHYIQKNKSIVITYQIYYD
jgi:hypothetical protein